MRANAGSRRAADGRDPGMCRYADEQGIWVRASASHCMISPADSGGFGSQPGARGGRQPRPGRAGGPGQTLHSGAPKRRDPGSSRYAGQRGISTGGRRARSRNVPLCGPTRDMGARKRAHCMISPADAGGSGPSRVLGAAAAPGPGRAGGPGQTLHSGAPKRRDPGSSRYAGKRGISAARRLLRSRNVPLCGPTRDKVRVSALIV
jgi:hypothetical protein